ncbi:serine hydrolase [Galbibacter pacificus]|uniref:Serine hydrolase n=1 Tax=Galbibacter pacificus TaxID=2996052 RepID=A0ABT6FUK4_9FLAO|nr:serine hydrolase [Galbibacter pacificus]MDG3583572.1 serine hydrolase [Galbibacter pacificus]MDG3586952.1 serine hydrolase [Galbibacter pacificus]
MKYKNNSLTAISIFLLFLLVACASEKDPTNLLDHVLASKNSFIKNVIDSTDYYEVQILLSTIQRTSDKVTFTDYAYHVDDNNYFYPASSVKFPISLLALEKLERDNRFDRNTKFYVEGDSLETTFEDEINKIYAVSDNEAFNRLFEYLGKDYINTTLKSKGLSPARISHRLSTDNAYELTTKPLIFYENDTVLTEVKGTTNLPIEELQLQRLHKGAGYVVGDSIIPEPMDFSLKNYLPVSTLHNTMKRIIFPDNFKEEERFQLNESDYNFVLKSMSSLPREHGYDPVEYYDSYGKFYIIGDTKENIPENIKIYNKVGYAYGYLTDCAYIQDTKNNVEFIITATINVNKNKIYNDGNYEYDTVGIPFLAELGREVYQNLKE